LPQRFLQRAGKVDVRVHRHLIEPCGHGDGLVDGAFAVFFPQDRQANFDERDDLVLFRPYLVEGSRRGDRLPEVFEA